MADDAREKGGDEQLPADEAALSARLKRLGERLGRVHADGPSDRSPSQRPATDPSAIARGFRLSTQIVAGVGVGAAIRRALDRRPRTVPWPVIVLLLLGFAAV